MAHVEHERVATDGTVKQLANKDDPGLSGAFITVEGAAVRARWDGGNPVGTSSGHLFQPGDSFRLNSAYQIQNFKVTQDSGAGAIEVTFDERLT